MPTIRPARRYDSPSSSTAATASRRTSNDSGRVPPCQGGRGGVRWARRAASQPSTLAGSDERGQYDGTGARPPGRLEHLAYGLAPSTSGRTEHHDTLITTKGRKAYPSGGRAPLQLDPAALARVPNQPGRDHEV